ncbi:acyl-CoA carboxylase epsilon subunit [Nocardioides bigeumensis]|uniref:Acyl-CoA carboxylase subunit epsilon n=1 Tax=Nocardioides bigeumensis TaxID=433657 RepID=A0ABN2YGX7_9ACTN
MSAGQNDPTADQPVLRILTPDATPEEIAAIVAVFAALGSGSTPLPPKPAPAWNRPARLVRRTHRPGPEGWRLSGLPR